jgi:hypothetical protein
MRTGLIAALVILMAGAAHNSAAASTAWSSKFALRR